MFLPVVSKRFAFALSAAVTSTILGGCTLELPVALSSAVERDAVRLAQSQITIAGPAGYCVNHDAIDDGPEGGFVLMANCRALRGRRVAPEDRALALLTASISPPLSSVNAFNAERLAVFFDTQTGKAALSRAGDASTVEVLENFTSGETFFIHARDRAENPLGALSDEYWRAILMISGRLVTLTVTPYSAAPLRTGQLRAQTMDFAQSVAAANVALPEGIVSK